MNLARKMRLLVEALAHRPFAPRPARSGLEDKEDADQGQEPRPDRAERGTRPPVEDTGRVADLIAQKRQGEADQAGAPRAR